MNKSNIYFIGIFRDEFENYIEYKQSQGYYKSLYKKNIYELLNYNRYLDSLNLKEIKITEEMVTAYMESLIGKSQSILFKYECMVRQFSKFLKNQGYENIYVLEEHQVKNPRDYIPYVFSDNEIIRIFKVIDELEFKHHKELKLFYQTFFRLLYTTGLRLGEALSLKIDDVDLDNNIITVHTGKGNVSRLVPFKDSLAEWLKEYKAKNNKKTDIYFFESRYGGRKDNNTIGEFFRKTILRKANISSTPQKGHTRGACIHSFRHTFACNSLDQMIKDGLDSYCVLPYLSVYLGHTSVTNTEIYLRLTIQHYDEVIDQGHYIYEKGLGDLDE